MKRGSFPPLSLLTRFLLLAYSCCSPCLLCTKLPLPPGIAPPSPLPRLLPRLPQLVIALPFPAANTTVNFVLDTLRRKTLVTPWARDELGVLDGPGVGDQPDFGACVELPAARIGREHGDHFMIVMDAVVANREQASGSNADLTRRAARCGPCCCYY